MDCTDSHCNLTDGIDNREVDDRPVRGGGTEITGVNGELRSGLSVFANRCGGFAVKHCQTSAPI